MKNFKNLLILCFLMISSGALLAASSSGASTTCSALLNVEFPKLQDDEPKSLCDYNGSVVLVVNTASFCGFTKQYKGLENLYKKYQSQGLVVLGFPSNDFGNQEPGSNKEIADFCENTYGVKFPMFAKSRVKGPNANKLFLDLAEMSEQPRWNFHKYLINRDGNFVKSYSSFTSPNSRKLIIDIENLLKLPT
jgi:glutathione peroxidase